MKIIIVGAGKVGSALTQQLSADGHNVTVVDQDPRLIENIINIYDVMGVCGNGAVYSVQKEAEVERAELLIATTSSDELNILACLVARKLGAKHTIARIRNQEYTSSVAELRRRLEARATDTPEVIDQRVGKAEYEISFAPQFDERVVNDSLDRAVADARAVIEKHLGL